ncbi:NusA antitermination factor [Deinococcus proteolyticus MRP]|uniref:Transcription termination/antitermination protein NusA n=1 Tax=Deinococcus proteolyticus (strain ATCC 35074 / DSM 20540 / JCM 6276 / NBRC 101906 / NCIMB 13154 / VKM Ac-1939 / CCM 2703 / MRP) TaxID=693977 RepID=F0RLR1_DEIPM|nr:MULTISPECIES: transcription termination factor NusA [Deinococcus]ADY25900.1 NusA antitermination factor [Deinococcus proteolyticus MRP]MCY1702021.1 transcription termination factor NusA [Deinococcus sp. SL84]
MSQDINFADALREVAQQRNINELQLIEAFEESLALAYKRNIDAEKRVEVHLDPQSGELEVLIIKEVVEKVEDENMQISLAEALELDPGVEVGMEMEFPVEREQFSRIALQAAKQTLTQKMRETERNVVYNEYKDREGQVLTAQVVRSDNKGNWFVELGAGEAIMPPREQIPGEKLTPGNRVKIYLKEVRKTPKGPTILASRADERLLDYLLRQEIPEVQNGVVEIKAVSREAGQRSKVAVFSNNSNVDPIGACIGHRGGRIQAVTGELGRERVDVILWDEDQREFIRNALSPAKVGPIDLDEETGTATVTVTPDQLSLAIGKGGQNVRLAAKLTGQKIDLRETAAISDLDEAMKQAVEAEGEGKSGRDTSAFDALFADSKPAISVDAGGEEVPADGEQGEGDAQG